ncbi:MAG TPA: ATPase domain-containing protein [Longimicrobiales bacterium]|nr:ATPase domain-containing protein [Longimicrobiales bacterium]
MSQAKRLVIDQLPSGVPGLDLILGGGVPQGSFNLVAGAPGTGKTTLAQQFVFANASPRHTALFFTILGEPAAKMLRYQQQYTFFDLEKVDESIRFINLSDDVIERGLEGALERIIEEVEKSEARIVVVDSFRSLTDAVRVGSAVSSDLPGVLQRLAMHLTTWQVTSFLVGEYEEEEKTGNPIFTIADTILWLEQATENNSIVRKLQVVKVRGQAPMPGLHTYRITADGLQVFPRLSLAVDEHERETPAGRTSTGVPGLDEMMGGGIPTGDSVLVAGPSGSGKSVLATQFIAEGGKRGEAGVLVVFEEHPKEYLHRAEGLGFGVQGMIEAGMLEALYLRPLDLSPDETLHEIREAVNRVGATRVVIDSMSGFELALAPTFRTDFRESLYRLVGALTGIGITVLTTMEVSPGENELRFTPNVISFLADDLISLRYVEVERELRKVAVVVKMRGSQHSKAYREYEITERGFVVGGDLDGYTGRISGAPVLTRRMSENA